MMRSRAGGRGREVAFLLFAILVATASVTGTFWVYLSDSDGDSTVARLGSPPLAREFRAPKAYDLATLRSERPFECRAEDAECARAYLGDITVDYGPRASLALLGELKRDRRIASTVDEHNLAHIVGRRAAERFGVNLQAFELCPITFNYGCPHGYFEEVLGTTETPQEAAALICESLAGSPVGTARFSCYHGVGHGVMMAEAYDLDGSLQTCDSLTDQTAQEGCWQGVFMENVNGALKGEARQGVFTPANPLAPCDGVAGRYRHQCYINHAGWLLHVRGDLGKASRACLAATRDYVSVCMESLGLMVTNPVWQATLASKPRRPFGETAWQLCTRFPAAHRSDCVVAGVDNLGNFDRLDIRRSLAFCAAVAQGLREACYRRIGLNLERQSTSRELTRARCATVPARYEPACRAGAGLS